MPTPSAANARLPIAPEITREPRTKGCRLPDAAVRALAEAAAHRSERRKPETSQAVNEVDGRGGLDPTRYGDWEVNGLASDF